MDIRDGPGCSLLKDSQAQDLIGIRDINQMMWNPRHLFLFDQTGRLAATGAAQKAA